MRRAGMPQKPTRTIVVATLLILMVGTANASTSSGLYNSTTASTASPNVIFQAGNVGNSTIFAGGTSARVTTPTLNYPTSYNVLTGTYSSGTTPGSVNAIDSNWFTTTSSLYVSDAFKDGASVSIGTSLASIDSIATTLPSGTNIVIATVQLDNTAGSVTTISAGNIQLRRGVTSSDPLITQTTLQTIIRQTGSAPDGQYVVLFGTDTSAPANPTYGVLAQAAATGITAEVKFLVLNSVPNSSFGDGSSVSLTANTETTVLSQATSLPAGDNIIVSLVHFDTGSSTGITIAAGNIKLKKGSTVLTSNQFALSMDPATNGRGNLEAFLIAKDTGAAANPTYTLTVNSPTAISAAGKILVFSGLSSSLVDTGSVAIAATRTQIGSVSTSFAVGDDIAIGSFQLDNTNAGTTTIPPAGIEMNRIGELPANSTNFRNMSYRASGSVCADQYSMMIRKVTTSSASPSYEGAAAGAGFNGKLTLVAVHVNDASSGVAETEFKFPTSSSTPTQINFTIVHQYTVASASVAIQVYNYTGSAYPTSGQGYLAYTSSSTPNTDETKSLTITTNPQQYMSSGVVRIKLKGFLAYPSFSQKTNFVQLYYYQTTYDYLLKIVNQQATSYNIKLDASAFTPSSIARITNFTAWFHTPNSVQLQILSGSMTTQTGPTYTLGSSATIFLAIRLTTSSAGLSTVDSYLRIYPTGSTTTHTDYRLTFKLT